MGSWVELLAAQESFGDPNVYRFSGYEDLIDLTLPAGLTHPFPGRHAASLTAIQITTTSMSDASRLRQDL